MQKQYVLSLFNSIARRYDLLNHLLSGGVDMYWRRMALEHLRPISPQRILDVATGTADFAIAATRLRPREIIGVDIADRMLEKGRDKLRTRGLQEIIRLQSGDAEHLDFPSGSFDAAIVAFGARNFEDLEQGLGEMHRVLRAGGMLVVLEFSKPNMFPLKQIYFFYFLKVLPFIGSTISRNREAYAYLPESVLRFPEGEGFLSVLKKIGFRTTMQRRMTFGIASIYTGVK